MQFLLHNEGLLGFLLPPAFVQNWPLISILFTIGLLEFSSNIGPQQGAQQLDQQWINSGWKQSSRHLNKKFGLPISFFLDETKKYIEQIPKNIALTIFENEAPKAALSMFKAVVPRGTYIFDRIISSCIHIGSISLCCCPVWTILIYYDWRAGFNLACMKTKVLLPPWKQFKMIIWTKYAPLAWELRP